MDTLDVVLGRSLIFPPVMGGLRITLLVPCFNEEKNIRSAILSWLTQTRKADEIIVVDDSSTDATHSILSEFSSAVRVVRTSKNLGNKSYAQEFGLSHVTGDIIITTDGDTRLDRHFIERIEKDFQDPSVAAVAGYVKSIPYNLLTACRSLDYVIGQNIDKVAQEYLDFMFVIPGAAGAFRADVFKNIVRFEHDTLAEDLDFTYKLHKKDLKIKYDREAICYTQDPSDLGSYVKQMRRWYGGGWQNLLKHLCIPKKPGMALELSLIYIEGLIFSLLLFVLPFVNIAFSALVFSLYCGLVLCFASVAAAWERRFDMLFAAPWYVLLRYVHAWIFIEQFVRVVILRRNGGTWQRPLRVTL